MPAPRLPGNVSGGGGRIVSGGAPAPRISGPISRRPVKRSFFGSITHGLTHPGISDIAAAVSLPMAAAWAAEHSHVPGLTQAGRASQALFESPLYLAAHPKAGAKNLGTMARGLVETPTALYKASGIDPLVYQATHPFARGGGGGGIAPRSIGGLRVVGTKGADKTALNALGALWHATKTDYSQRYGKDWKKYAAKEPLFNVADLLMVAGPAGEAASGARALRTLSRMGVETEDEQSHGRSVTPSRLTRSGRAHVRPAASGRILTQPRPRQGGRA